MPNKKKLSAGQEQKDQQPRQQSHQQQKTKQTPRKPQTQQVFHDHERIETRMTD